MSSGDTKNIFTSEPPRICDALPVTRFITEPERGADRMEVERLYDASFGGNARWQRPVYELRRGYSPVAALCSVVKQQAQVAEAQVAEAQAAEDQAAPEEGEAEQARTGRIVAALRFWEVRIKEKSSVPSPSVPSRGTTKDASREQRPRTQAEKQALLFGPLAVCAEVQGKGLGKALVERSIAEARRLGYGGILISGVAAYYRPFGFRTLCVEGLRMPKPSPGHVLMGLELKPHYLLSAQGEVLPERRNVCRS